MTTSAVGGFFGSSLPSPLRAPLHLVERLGELAVAGRFFVVSRVEPDEAEVGAGLAGSASAGEGDHLAVGRPDRIVFAVGMARDVERLPLAGGGEQPNIAVEFLVELGVYEPFAVGRPIVIGGIPAVDDVLLFGFRQIDDVQIAAFGDVGQLLAVGAQLEFAGPVEEFDQTRHLEFAVLPPELLGVLPRCPGDGEFVAEIDGEEDRLPVRRKERAGFLGGRLGDLPRLAQLGVHDPQIAAGENAISRPSLENAASVAVENTRCSDFLATRSTL